MPSRSSSMLSAGRDGPASHGSSATTHPKGDVMPTLDHVKRAVCEAIDRQSQKIVTVGETIRKSPELGFKEFKTAKLVEETMREIGLSPKSGLAITGVRAEAQGKSEGPTFALLGELDGLVVAGHPVADPQTGAAHACGHNAQIAGMLGAAMGLMGARSEERRVGKERRARWPPYHDERKR